MKAVLAGVLLLFSLLAQAGPTNIDPRVARYDTCGRFELFYINGVLNAVHEFS